jgi:hypothetical protein
VESTQKHVFALPMFRVWQQPICNYTLRVAFFSCVVFAVLKLLLCNVNRASASFAQRNYWQKRSSQSDIFLALFFDLKKYF